MHVLYVIDSLVPSGAERSLAALAPHYVQRGIVLDVAYLLDRPGLQGELEAAGARLFSLAGPGGRPGWTRRIRRLIRERRPDLVHTTLFEADVAGRVAARLGGVPSVTSLVSVPYGPGHLEAPGLRRWKVRGAQAVDVLTARLATRFHAVAGYVADVMAKRLRIPRGHIDVVPRGRDLGVLGSPSPERRARARTRLEAQPDDIVVLAVARQEHPKGLDVLVQAFSAVLEHQPRARLMIAGRSGNASNRLRALASHPQLQEKVALLGPRHDVPDLLCGSDLCVIPSRWEGFPGTLIEAMAMGTPIVATALPVIREISADGDCARLVPVNDPKALARGVLDVVQHPEQASRRAAAAQARFRAHFTMDRVVEGMEAFYERSLAPTRTPIPPRPK
jgi:glycosyltransferase involved in cell wall biosynthesis